MKTFVKNALVNHRPNDALSRHILGQASLNEVFEVVGPGEVDGQTEIRSPTRATLEPAPSFSLPTEELVLIGN